jgi:hypothetical protein
MSLVDSLDSILMLYAYAEPSRESPDGKLQLFQPRAAIALPVHHDTARVLDADGSVEAGTDVLKSPTIEHTSLIKTKANTISMLSIILTVLSIVVALRYVIGYPALTAAFPSLPSWASLERIANHAQKLRRTPTGAG